MNRLPPQPLDAQERALAAQLPRLHGRSEPTAELDARILAAAHAAAQQPAKPARRRWAAPLALAASLCLAVGVAWRVQFTPAPPAAPASSAQRAAPDVAAEAARTTMPAADSARAISNTAPPVTQRPAPIRAPSAASTPPPQRVLAPPPPPEAPPVVLESPRAFAQDAAPAPAPPPAPPVPAAAARAATAAATTEAAQPMANGALAPTATRSSDTLAAPSARRPEAVMGKARQDQRLPEPASADAPLDDVPPATMASPAARDAWLKRIRQLHQQGDLDAARASLAEFRRRYPQATLPPDLRELEHARESTTPDPAAH